jgi:phosphatidylserine synthase
MINIEKSEKLPVVRRYFNISILWIFYFRQLIRLLYYIRIPHEVVTALSIVFGIISAYFFYIGALIMAALFLHLKDLFDACDGALARLTGRGHLIGRYLDSLGDFLSLTMVLGAIALSAAQNYGELYYFWGGLAIISTFIQCSLFNYYQLAYLESYGIKTLSSRRNEIARQDIEPVVSSGTAGIFLSLLRFVYIIVYSWQDRLIAAVDDLLSHKAGLSESSEKYADQKLMTLQSALCFGTHIFIIIIFALIGRPGYALIFIATIMNLYMILLLYLRSRSYNAIERKISTEGRYKTDPIESEL